MSFQKSAPSRTTPNTGRSPRAWTYLLGWRSLSRSAERRLIPPRHTRHTRAPTIMLFAKKNEKSSHRTIYFYGLKASLSCPSPNLSWYPFYRSYPITKLCLSPFSISTVLRSALNRWLSIFVCMQYTEPQDFLLQILSSNNKRGFSRFGRRYAPNGPMKVPPTAAFING